MGGAAVGVIAATALVAQMSIVSNASWLDSEWVSAPSVGTVDCTDPEGAFVTRGNGRALSGSLLGIDLDDVAEASGVTVTNDGQRDVHTPQGALPATAPPAWADPLNVGLLSQAINLDLGNGLLQLPLDNSTGAVGQFGSASTFGVAEGAAGFITSSGGIATAPGSGYPELATLKLKQLLAQTNPIVADTLGDVTDLSLEIGALTGRAELDGCSESWSALASDAITREYLIASLSSTIESPTIVTLRDAVSDAIAALQPAVNGILADQGLLNSITGPLVANLTSILAGPNGSGLLRIDGTDIAITATVDTSALTALLSLPITDSHNIVSIDLTGGKVSIDFAALVGKAYSGQQGLGLNGLPPNTDLLANASVLNVLSLAISEALSDWIGVVEDTLTATIDSIDIVVALQVNLSVFVTVLVTSSWIEIGSISATVSGSLLDLLADTGTIDAELVLLSGLSSIPILGTALVALLNGALKPVTNLLTSTIKSTLGGLVGAALDGVLDGLRVLPPTVNEAVTGILDLVESISAALFLSGTIQLLVNAQNRPESGAPAPLDWAEIPPGQYDVAALRVGILGLLSENDVRLYLGRGSVGPVCSQAEVAAGACANY
ncbi:choice-of-anchor G family protein [Leucobacter sp. HY1908]